jgi:hypothetical protein
MKEKPPNPPFGEFIRRKTTKKRTVGKGFEMTGRFFGARFAFYYRNENVFFVFRAISATLQWGLGGACCIYDFLGFPSICVGATFPGGPT